MSLKIINSIVKRTKTTRLLESRIGILESIIRDNVDYGYVKLKNGSTMFLPELFADAIQQDIFLHKDFYEREILDDLYTYIEGGEILLDIGANIGNHTVYWATNNQFRAIHSFEPVKAIFNILKKNIEINQLDASVTCYNIGLGFSQSKARISNVKRNNIGATSLVESSEGDIEINSIDNIVKDIGKVDFIKIDVEGFEIDVLNGAAETLKNWKPKIFIETFAENKKAVFSILSEYKYKMIKEYPFDNYLFIRS